jgi:hypothetical protein
MFVIADSIFFAVGKERQREEKGGAQATDSKQSNDQVEVKTDRFSGVTTVKLKPQAILDKPDHQMTIDIETKVGGKGRFIAGCRTLWGVSGRPTLHNVWCFRTTPHA